MKEYTNNLTCRACNEDLPESCIDLGCMPLANSLLNDRSKFDQEQEFSLHLKLCPKCLLLQLGTTVNPEIIFDDYPYYSSFSSTWLAHLDNYVSDIVKEFPLQSEHLVLEIGSNDGCLLSKFSSKGFKVLGVEPSYTVAHSAQAKGIETIQTFFTTKLANNLTHQGIKANLIIGNNVLAHVPNINDLFTGVHQLLAHNGIATFEFPHVLKLMNDCQFDTIYHEHYYYYSIHSICNILKVNNLQLFKVKQLPTHGGSLRIYVQPSTAQRLIDASVYAIYELEKRHKLEQIKTYEEMQKKAEIIKSDLNSFLAKALYLNKQVVGYGAPAKGNTLLNYCKVTRKHIEYVVDINPHKQNRFLPGSHIPVYSVEKILETKPDYVLILPWNIKDEIKKDLSYIRDWGGKFVTPIPTLQIE